MCSSVVFLHGPEFFSDKRKISGRWLQKKLQVLYEIRENPFCQMTRFACESTIFKTFPVTFIAIGTPWGIRNQPFENYRISLDCCHILWKNSSLNENWCAVSKEKYARETIYGFSLFYSFFLLILLHRIWHYKPDAFVCWTNSWAFQVCKILLRRQLLSLRMQHWCNLQPLRGNLLFFWGKIFPKRKNMIDTWYFIHTKSFYIIIARKYRITYCNHFTFAWVVTK